MTAAICLGSNLGDRSKHLKAAIDRISARGYHIISESNIYETAPVEYQSDHYFLNQVILVKTENKPESVLLDLLDTESELGRKRNTNETSDRTIDLDLLFYDDLVLQIPGLILPHPRLHLRRFVLKPLAEVAQGWIHPTQHQTVAALLEICSDKQNVFIV
jgi:2-amino-4-hydroxy-6-hydroxymethyldihydropteridine diphosphokinase